MSTLNRDSFDFYTTISDAALGTDAPWQSATGSQANVNTTTRFGVGKSLQLIDSATTNSGVTSQALANTSDVFIGMAVFNNQSSASTTENCHLRFIDGTSTVQMRISFVKNGNLNIYRGDGTTLLTSFTNVFPGLTWTQAQIRVIFSGTVGEIHIRLNGNTSDDFSATGLNNITSGNARMNKYSLFNGGHNDGGNFFFDDHWCWSNDGTYPTTWLGDFRAIQIMPNADTAQKDFTIGIASSQIGISTQVSTNTISLTANNVILTPVQTVVGGGPITTVSLNMNAGFTGHANVAIYDSDGASGVAGTKLAEATAITNPVTGLNTFTLTSTLVLQNQHKYYLAYLADTTATAKAGASATRNFVAQTFSSGFPSSLTGLSSGSANTPLLFSSVTLTNNGEVNELTQDGSATFVSNATAGDTDLYTTAGLAVTPDAIFGLSVRGFVAKSDAGARSGTVTMLSGSTSQDGPTLSLATTFGNIIAVQDVDPATSLAWTAGAVNALQIGPKVVS